MGRSPSTRLTNALPVLGDALKTFAGTNGSIVGVAASKAASLSTSGDDNTADPAVVVAKLKSLLAEIDPNADVVNVATDTFEVTV